MERYVKERLVGAAVLVAAGIILIPEMLSGPKDWAERTAASTGESEGTLKSYSIDLSKRNDMPERTDVGAGPPAQAAAATTTPPPGPTESQRAAANSGQTPGPHSTQDSADSGGKVQTGATPPSEEADASSNVGQSNDKAGERPHSAQLSQEVAVGKGVSQAAHAGGGWAVQIGSYATAARAQKEVAELKAKGFGAFVMPFKLQDKTLYRVRVGPQSERGSAEAVAAKLHAKGLAGAVVKHPVRVVC